MKVEYLQLVDKYGKERPWEKMYHPDSLDGKYIMVELSYNKNGVEGFDDRRGYYLTLRLVKRTRRITNGDTITTTEKVAKTYREFYTEGQRYSRKKENFLMDFIIKEDFSCIVNFAKEANEKIDW